MGSSAKLSRSARFNEAAAEVLDEHIAARAETLFHDSQRRLVNTPPSSALAAENDALLTQLNRHHAWASSISFHHEGVSNAHVRRLAYARSFHKVRVNPNATPSRSDSLSTKRKGGRSRFRICHEYSNGANVPAPRSSDDMQRLRSKSVSTNASSSIDSKPPTQVCLDLANGGVRMYDPRSDPGNSGVAIVPSVGSTAFGSSPSRDGNNMSDVSGTRCPGNRVLDNSGNGQPTGSENDRSFSFQPAEFPRLHKKSRPQASENTLDFIGSLLREPEVSQHDSDVTLGDRHFFSGLNMLTHETHIHRSNDARLRMKRSPGKKFRDLLALHSPVKEEAITTAEHNRIGYARRKGISLQHQMSVESASASSLFAGMTSLSDKCVPAPARTWFNWGEKIAPGLKSQIHALTHGLMDCSEGPDGEQEVYACTKVTVETRHVVFEAVNRIAALLTILSSARTWSDALINFVASIALMADRETLAQIEEFLGFSERAPQAGFDIREMLLQLKTGLKDPEKVPIIDVLKKCFMVATLVGLRDVNETRDSGCLTDIFRAWDRQSLRMTKFDLVDCAIDIALFTHELVTMVESGAPLSSILMPRTVATRLAKLEALIGKFKAGNINPEEDDMDMDEYRGSVIRLKCEASTALAQSTNRSFSEIEAAQRVYTGTLKLYTTVKMCGMNMAPRAAAFGLMIYGETSVGKTTVMYAAAAYLGSLCGFPADPKRNFYNKSQKDAFASGYTKTTNILAFDDAGNAVEGHLMEESIEEMSNVAKFSVQADLDLKGVLPYDFDMGIGTTNHWDARVKKFSTAPGSILRRFTWIDVSCPENANGRFDHTKVYNSDGSYNDQHVVQEYTFSFPNTTSKNYTKELIGEPMPLMQWLELRAGPLVQDWRLGQDKYLKTMGNTDIFSCCPHGRVLATCMECRESEKFAEAREKQFSLAIPRWLATGCSIYANASIPIFDRLFDRTPGFIARCVSESAWNGLMAIAKQSWLEVSIRLAPFGVLWHCFLYLVYCQPKNWLHGVFVLVTIAAFSLWSLRKACRSYVAYTIESSLRGPSGLYAAFTVGQLGFLYAFSRRILQQTAVDHQSLAATPEAQQARCAEVNHWLGSVEPAPCVSVVGKVRTMTHDQVIALIQKCIGRLSYLENGLSISTSYTRISPRELIVPAHFATRLKAFNADVRVNVLRSNKNSTMIPYTAVVDEFRFHEIGDLCIMVMSEGPPGPHLRDLVCETLPRRNVSATLLRCSKEGEKSVTVYADCMPTNAPSDTRVDSPHAPGILYAFLGNGDATEAGDCGSPLVSNEFPHVILGFHVGGGATHGLAHVGGLAKFNSSESALVGRISKQSFEPLPIADYMETESIEGISIVPLSVEPGERSPMRFLPMDANAPHAYVCASEVPPRAPKSEVRITCVSSSLEDVGIPCKFERPKINANRNGAAYIHYALSPLAPIAPSLLRRVVKEYIATGIHGMRNYTPGPLFRDISIAMNGIKGDKFSKPMKLKTAAGVYLPGKKEKYVQIDVDSEGGRTIHPTALLKERVEHMMDNYVQGKQCSPIVRAACKDEPVMKEEYAGKKKIVRQFMVCPMEFLVVGRMLLAELVKAFLLHPFVFGMVQGTNTITGDWTELKDYFLDDFENIIEGDYSKYDVRMSAQLIRAVGAIFAQFALSFGAEGWHARAIHTYFEDLAVKHISIAGVFVGISGWNTSGHGVTIEANGIMNKLIYMCAYYHTADTLHFEKVPQFDQVVRMMYMGDDSAGKSYVPWFNMHSMEVFCTAHNMPYTLGDKGEISAEKPFLEDGKNVVFCKRRWRWVPRRRLYDCPLELDSILKPLHVRMMNADLSDHQYLKGMMNPTLIELARHPQEVFDDCVSKIGQAFLAVGVWFEELEKSYSEMQLHNDQYYTQEQRLSFDPIVEVPSPNVLIAPLRDLSEERLNQCSLLAVKESSPIQRYMDHLSPVVTAVKALPLDGYCGQPMKHALQQFGFAVQIWCIDPASSNTNDFLVHDSEHSGHGMANLGIGSAIQGADYLDNSELMSREVKIATIEWRHNTPEFIQFNPWSLLFEDRVLANRLGHFRLLRCMGLELRFTLSGNPMMMGRMLCSYVPLHNQDNTLLHRAGVDADLVEATQRSHVILDPALSSGGSMTLPYNYPVPFYDILERDWNNAGLVTVQTINNLAHATGQEGSAFINVFARAISPNVSVGTSQLPLIAPQMDRVTDAATGDMKDIIQPLALTRNKAVMKGPEDVQLAELAKRKCLLTTFEWSESQTPGTHLFSVEVTPQLYKKFNDEVHMTPSCWTTNPFEYWRSDMEYVFEVVCSGLHRGKLVIRWDPAGFNDSYRDDFHLTRSMELDMTQSSTESLTVGWGSPFPYLETAPRGVFDTPCFQTEPSMVPRKHTNGTISVYVLNSLTVPNELGPSSLSVNVYAGTGSGYQVFSLTPRIMRCLKLTESSNDDDQSSPDAAKPAPDGGFPNNTLVPVEPPPNGSVDVDPPSNTNPPGDVDPPVPTTIVPIEGARFFRTGPVSSPLNNSSNDQAIQRENRGTTGNSFAYYYDGTNPPTLEFVITSGNGWQGDGEFTTEAGSVVLPRDEVNSPAGFRFAAPIPDQTGKEPGWYTLPYTTEVPVNRVLIWLKCIRIGVMNNSGITYLRQGTQPSFNQSLGDGYIGANYTIPTTVTLGNKVLNTPIQVVARAGARVSYNGGSDVYEFTRDEAVMLDVGARTPQLEGPIIEIGYLFQIVPQSAEEAIAPEGVDETDATNLQGGPTLGQPVMPPSEMMIAADEYINDWYSILNRFTASYSIRGNNTSVSLILPHYPVEHYSSREAHSTFIRNGLFEYVARAYLGARGSMNVKISRDPRGVGELKHRTFTVDRLPATQEIVGFSGDTKVVTPFLLSGTAWSNDIMQAGMDVNVPHYSNYRYYASRANGMRGLDLTHAPGNIWLRGWLSDTESLIISYSQGHDFSLESFISTPVMVPCSTINLS